MSRKTSYIYNVETIRSGQPRRYADSEYEFIVSGTEYVTNGDGTKSAFPISHNRLKNYCLNVLMPNRQTLEDWMKGKSDSAAIYFAGYHTFSEVQGQNNAIRYYVRIPFCD